MSGSTKKKEGEVMNIDLTYLPEARTNSPSEAQQYIWFNQNAMRAALEQKKEGKQNG